MVSKYHINYLSNWFNNITLIINLVVSSLTVVSRIAILPWYQAAIMVGVSVLLTLVSGVFPARAAAKKDPVVALRTE